MKSLMIPAAALAAMLFGGCAGGRPVAQSDDLFDQYHGHASGTALLSGGTFARTGTSTQLEGWRQPSAKAGSARSADVSTGRIEFSGTTATTLNPGGSQVAPDAQLQSLRQPAEATNPPAANPGDASGGGKPITTSGAITIKGSFPEPTIALPDK